MRLLVFLILLATIASSAFAEDPDQKVAGFQAGAFLVAAHAKALNDKLGDQDFYSDVRQKVVNGRTFWVVVVPASTIPFQDFGQSLKKAGFSAIPLTGAQWKELKPDAAAPDAAAPPLIK